MGLGAGGVWFMECVVGVRGTEILGIWLSG